MVWFAAPGVAGEFFPPVKVTAGGKPIDVQRTAHSAPCVGDIDGDGLDDLLVGEFYEGRMRIFHNVGSSAQPKFDKYEWFKAGGDLGRVPTG
jgi:hypothetical protein